MESVRVTREEVKHFLSIKIIDGCGYGKGDGFGSGYGDGLGLSYSEGFGFGLYLGSGDGHINGSGDGSGFSDGNGSEDGSGEGGDVSVMDIKTFNGHIINYIDGVPTIITHIHNDIASGFIIGFDMTLIPCYAC